MAHGSPKYIDSFNEVPATGPDPYTETQKRRAVARGEARVEADINNGNELASPEQIHADAANYFASYLLHLGPRAPDSVTMGDSADEGEGRIEFADRMYELYKSTVDAIVAAEGDEGEGGSGAGGEDGESTGPPNLMSFGGPPQRSFNSTRRHR